MEAAITSEKLSFGNQRDRKIKTSSGNKLRKVWKM